MTILGIIMMYGGSAVLVGVLLFAWLPEGFSESIEI